MKKWLIKLSLVAMAILLLPFQAVEACCGFYHWTSVDQGWYYPVWSY